MKMYKNDGSGEAHIYSDNLHIKVVKGVAQLVTTLEDSVKEAPPPNTREISPKTLSKAARRSIRALIEEHNQE